MNRVLLAILVLCFLNVKSQNVGIGTGTPAAALEVHSTTSGILIPRMSTTQRLAIVAPPLALMVFDTTVKNFYYHTGSYWKPIGLTGIKEFVATQGQTVFVPDIDITDIPINHIAVYHYIRLGYSEWSKSGSSILLNTPAGTGDVIFIDIF